MAWSTSAPKNITWSGNWKDSDARVGVNNYANYMISARIGRGSNDTIAVAIKFLIYARNFGDTAYIDMNGSVKVGSGSWNRSGAYTCSGGFGAYNESRTIYYTGSAASGVTVYVRGDWNENYTGSVSFSAPSYTTTYKITYNANGGSGAPSSQTKVYNTTLKLSSTKPTNTGYNFLGWNTKSDGSGTSYAAGANYTANAAATLYAQWSRITYAVSFEGNENTGGSTPDQTKVYGTALAISQNGFTRTNYSFLYWNTAADGSGDTYEAGATYNENAPLTLYAIWKKNNIPVYINDNGTIRQVEKAYMNVGGVVKECTVYLNVGGVIKTIV